GGVGVPTKKKSLVNDLVKRVHVRMASTNQAVKSLSDGNQQEVVIAKWIGIEPRVVLIDEPTRGDDNGAKKENYWIMNELSEEGMDNIMNSSELPEVHGISDRIMVRHEGNVTRKLMRE